MTQDEEDAMRRMRHRGLGPGRIAQLLGMDRKRVTRELRRLGLERSMKPRQKQVNRIWEDHGEEIRSLYESGKCSVTVGAIFGIASSTVLKGLRQQGVQTRPPGPAWHHMGGKVDTPEYRGLLPQTRTK